MKKRILTCAVTGSGATVGKHPAIPVTPEQIANSAIGAAKAGAAVVHIHVRDPETGRGSMEMDYYRETVERIRESDVDVVINLTTGPGAWFFPGKEDPNVPGPGTNLCSAEKRIHHVLELKPEICTLDLNTMWFRDGVLINAPEVVSEMAKAVQSAGVLPEIEVFDTGDIQLARHLIDTGVLTSRALFQIVLGVKYGAIATPGDDALHAKPAAGGGSLDGIRRLGGQLHDAGPVPAAWRARADRTGGYPLPGKGRASP